MPISIAFLVHGVIDEEADVDGHRLTAGLWRLQALTRQHTAAARVRAVPAGDPVAGEVCVELLVPLDFCLPLRNLPP